MYNFHTHSHMYVQFRFGPIFCWPFAFFFLFVSISPFSSLRKYYSVTSYLIIFLLCPPANSLLFSFSFSLYSHRQVFQFLIPSGLPIYPSIYLFIYPPILLSFLFSGKILLFYLAQHKSHQEECICGRMKQQQQQRYQKQLL